MWQSGDGRSMSFGVRSLSVSLDAVEVLHAVDLDVPAGSVVAVVGGDGAGKSTLLRCLVGKLVPSAGEVHRPDRQLVGYMPSTSGTWRQLTVAENVDFVGGAFRMSASSDETKLGDIVNVVAGLVSLEPGGEFLSVVEDLLGGAGHGGHLGYFGPAGMAWTMISPSPVSS